MRRAHRGPQLVRRPRRKPTRRCPPRCLHALRSGVSSSLMKPSSKRSTRSSETPHFPTRRGRHWRHPRAAAGSAGANGAQASRNVTGILSLKAGEKFDAGSRRETGTTRGSTDRRFIQCVSNRRGKVAIQVRARACETRPMTLSACLITKVDDLAVPADDVDAAIGWLAQVPMTRFPVFGPIFVGKSQFGGIGRLTRKDHEEIEVHGVADRVGPAPG